MKLKLCVVLFVMSIGVFPASADEALKNLKGLAIEAYHPARGMNFSETTVQDLRRLNVQIIRVEMVQEFAGWMDYSKYDTIVDRAAQYGMEILGLIAYQSLAWSDTEEWGTEDFRIRFVDRVEEIVTHYKDRPNPIRYWEIWNEPDLNAPGFNVRIEPEPYADLLIASYEKIKSLDPSAVVLFGGVSPKGFEYWPPQENYIDAVYSTAAMQDYYAANGFYPFDVMAIHPYPETFTNPANGNLAGVVNDKVKVVMDSHGDTEKPVWFTEMGWNSAHVTETQQANYLRDSYLVCRDELPYVEKYIWFKYDEWEGNLWGLVTADHSRRKPSYDAYYQLAPGPDPDEADSSWEMKPGLDDSVLTYQVDATDLLHGNPGEILEGGFYGSPDLEDRVYLTDGNFHAAEGGRMILADYGDPSLKIRYDLGGVYDLTEIRIFAAHGSPGNRAFLSVDVSVDGDSLVGELNTGFYGQPSPDEAVVSMVRHYDRQGGFIAEGASEITFTFYCVSEVNHQGFIDRWDPGDPQDTDGEVAAYVASIVKEIDVFGSAQAQDTPTPSPTETATVTPTPTPTLTPTSTPIPWIEQNTGTLGAAGGQIQAGPNGYFRRPRLIVPAGSLDRDTAFEIRQPDGEHGTRTSVELLPEGTLFSIPATLEMEFHEDDIPVGRTAGEMKIHRWDRSGGNWVFHEGLQHLEQQETGQWTLSTLLEHLSVYGVLESDQLVKVWQVY